MRAGRSPLEEFWDADDKPGYLCEVARGGLEVSEILGESHFQVVDNLHEAFSLHRQFHPDLILRVGRESEVRFISPDLKTDRHPDYLAIGLLEYWTVDPDEERVTVWSRIEVDGGPAWDERVFRGEEIIASGSLPGFAATVAPLWAEMDDED